ncbi:MAG: transposase [Planctomycetaceae bacterium]|nr:transposase [Planctomycetales bacterium]MCB9923956.1 transposase [Planctomycetaceae bacterium]
MELAEGLHIRLLFLPGYSPNLNLNLIERLWKFIKRDTLRGRYYADFATFRAAITACLTQLSTTHRPKLESLMTLNFQTFENASVMMG